MEKHRSAPGQVAEIISSCTEKQELGSKVSPELGRNVRVEKRSGKAERKCVFRNDPRVFGLLVKVEVTDASCLFAKNSHDKRK